MVRLHLCQVFIQLIDVFPRGIYAKVPRKRSYPHMHFITVHALPLLLDGKQKCQNVSEVDGERNLEISVYD